MIALAKKLLKPPVYWLERELYVAGLLSLGRLTLPHFLVLGSGQSGTTWLQTVLGRHPEIFLPDRKETHYFDRQINGWPLSYYASLFAEGVNMVRGEICPLYNILRRERIRTIRRIMPDVRLVLIVRNPIDRSWSEARRSLGKVANQRGVALEQLDESEFYRYFEKEWTCVPEFSGDYEAGLRQGYYSKCIDNWLEFFPPQQLHVCFFDEIVADAERFLRSICEHIGVDTNFVWPPDALHTIVNQNPKYVIPKNYRIFLENRYASEIEELYRRFGGPVELWGRQT